MQKKAVDLLVKKGREQGFLTQEEILEVFPDAEDKVQDLDDFYGKLLTENIDVFESVTPDEIESDEKEQDKLEREIEILTKLGGAESSVLTTGLAAPTCPAEAFREGGSAGGAEAGAIVSNARGSDSL